MIVRFIYIFSILTFLLNLCLGDQEILPEIQQLNENNFFETIKKYKLSYVNFFATWCRYSLDLRPTWQLVHEQISKSSLNESVLVAQVDSDESQGLCKKLGVTKYPTIKILLWGHMSRAEYRGQRSMDSIVRHITEQEVERLTVLHDKQDLDLFKDKTIIIGSMSSNSSEEFRVFKRVAYILKDICHFIVAFGDTLSDLQMNSNGILLRKAFSDTFKALDTNISPTDEEELIKWIKKSAISLVREITYQNAEELTEEGKPFLIYFHDPSDQDGVLKFTRIVEQNLSEYYSSVTFLTANGHQFIHPLHHLGKTKNDLPVIAIDSFRHMYLFPDASRMHEENALSDFIQKLKSGRLHHEFHYGTESTTKQPESAFKKLAPSDTRYSFEKDEL